MLIAGYKSLIISFVELLLIQLSTQFWWGKVFGRWWWFC